MNRSISDWGGNLIIVDDPLKPEDAMSDVKRSGVNDWYDRTLLSRLDNKRDDAIIVIMQRLHVEDLAGHVLTQESWDHLNLPAIADAEQKIATGPGTFYIRQPGECLHAEREPLEVLRTLKTGLGSFNFSAQYQQCPVPDDGEIISWKWFRIDEITPQREPDDYIIQSWDTASKAGPGNDYSVCTTWLVKGHDYHLLDVVRKKLVYPDLKRRVVGHARRFCADVVLIEDSAAGTGLLQDLHRESHTGIPKPIPIRPTTDKLTRMHIQSAMIEAGHVYRPRSADWLDAFCTEILQFPHGRYDDQVDSLSQFLMWIRWHQQPRPQSRFTWC